MCHQACNTTLGYAAYLDGRQGNFIKTRSAAPVYIYTPGYTTTTWHSKAIVSMFNDPVPVAVKFVFRAQSILNDLGPYIKSDGKTQPMNQEELLKRAAVLPSSAMFETDMRHKNL